MKNKFFGILQRIGRSFMLPIAILPVAGLLLGVGESFTNVTMLETYRLLKTMGSGTILYAVFKVMSHAGDTVFTNLPIIFAMGVAIGMAKKEKEVAALSAAISFLVMHASISALINITGGVDNMLSGATTSVCGILSLQMGVFGGIIVGLGVAALHNRFYKTELPQALSFFGGTRFVPIVSSIVYTGVGILVFFIWPVIQAGIYDVGNVVVESGYAGTWLYGLMERILVPFGLHHVFYLPFWQTAVGGTLEVQGVIVEGAQNIFFAQLADPSVTKFSVSATRFMSGKFPLMIFGLPGAAFAMYKTAKPEKKKEVQGLLISAALTSMLTGITEPIEFIFLFTAPLLYGIHCVLAGLSYMLMHIFEVGVGMTFSGGLIDLFLFGILQGNAKTNWVWVIIIGIPYFIVYYLLFSYFIRKVDLKTPGRDDSEEIKISDTEELLQTICNGLGGKKNISDIDCCATRLRCTVYKLELVNVELLKSTGASGIVHKGNGVQIVYGPRVTVIKSNLEEYLETVSDTEDINQNIFQEKIEEDDKTELTDGIAKSIIVYSPVTGISADLETVPDEAFAKRMMGDGVAVTPEEAIVVAPDDGKILFVFDTKHALGFMADSGVGVLLHMGINTVHLNGEGFNVFVESGQKVKKGDKLMELDIEFVKQHASSLVSPIICTELEDNMKVRLLNQGKIKAGEPLFAIDIYK